MEYTLDGLTVLVADVLNYKIKSIDVATNAVSTIAGSSVGSNDGVGTLAQFQGPKDIKLVRPSGTTAVIVDGSRIRSLDLLSNAVTVLAGSTSAGSADGTGTSATFNGPRGLALSSDGQKAYVCDYGNHKIRVVVIASQVVTTLAGSGTSGHNDATGASARFYKPHFVALTPDDSIALVTDEWNHRIRKIVIATRAVSTLAGSGSSSEADGVGTSASFGHPNGISITSDGRTAHFAQGHSSRIHALDIASATVTTIAGQSSFGSAINGPGSSAVFYYPHGVALSDDLLMAAR